jgi:hypothetical protein
MEFLATLPEGTDDRTAMAASVQKCAKVAFCTARHQDRMTTDISGEEIIWLRHLGFKTDEIPRGFEDVAEFGVKHFRVGKNAPVDLKDALLRAIIDEPRDREQMGIFTE